MRELENAEDELVPGEVVHALVAGEPPVRVWREYRGLTQAQLAERAGVIQGAVVQIENGQRQGSVAMLCKLVRALNVDLDDLVWGLKGCRLPFGPPFQSRRLRCDFQHRLPGCGVVDGSR